MSTERTHCCGHIVAHDVSWAAQTGKHLLRTHNVSEQNQKRFLCPGHKISVRNKCSGKRGNICVGNDVSGTMCPRLPGPLITVHAPFPAIALNQNATLVRPLYDGSTM